MAICVESVIGVRPNLTSKGAAWCHSRTDVIMSLRRVALLAGLFLVLWGVCGGSSPAVADSDPMLNIDRPLGRGPIFLLGSMSLGGTKDYESFAPGYGLSIVFRPPAASDFWRFLYRWNTAMVLQADYRRVSADRRLLAADLILRRYFSDMKKQTVGTSYFLGLGLGAAEITFPIGNNSSSDISYTYLVEFGSEKSPSENWVFVLKGQYRYYSHGEWDYSGWSVHFGVGISLPW